MPTRYWTTTGRRFEPSLCSGAVPFRDTTGEPRSEIIQMLLEVRRPLHRVWLLLEVIRKKKRAAVSPPCPLPELNCAETYSPLAGVNCILVKKFFSPFVTYSTDAEEPKPTSDIFAFESFISVTLVFAL